MISMTDIYHGPDNFYSKYLASAWHTLSHIYIHVALIVLTEKKGFYFFTILLINKSDSICDTSISLIVNQSQTLKDTEKQQLQNHL